MEGGKAPSNHYTVKCFCEGSLGCKEYPCSSKNQTDYSERPPSCMKRNAIFSEKSGQCRLSCRLKGLSDCMSNILGLHPCLTSLSATNQCGGPKPLNSLPGGFLPLESLSVSILSLSASSSLRATKVSRLSYEVFRSPPNWFDTVRCSCFNEMSSAVLWTS